MTTRPDAGGLALLLPVALTATAFGALTAFAQQWLPDEVGSLANSAGPWALIAFTLALPARRASLAGACSVLALICLVSGYYVTDSLRGFPASSRTVVLWVCVAVVAGPVFGLAAHWLRHGSAGRAALGAVVPAVLLVAEGCYGLAVIADTTYPPYWRAEIGAGVALLLAAAFIVGRRRYRTS